MSCRTAHIVNTTIPLIVLFLPHLFFNREPRPEPEQTISGSTETKKWVRRYVAGRCFSLQLVTPRKQHVLSCAFGLKTVQCDSGLEPDGKTASKYETEHGPKDVQSLPPELPALCRVRKRPGEKAPLRISAPVPSQPPFRCKLHPSFLRSGQERNSHRSEKNQMAESGDMLLLPCTSFKL